VLVTGTESWPTKLMGAKFSDDPLQECHVDPSLSHGSEHGGVGTNLEVAIELI
jgi:hypothetical protein